TGGRGEAAARRQNVVEDQHALARHDILRLDLERSLAVLERVALRDDRAGELALLAHRDDADARAVGHGGSEHEAARLDTGDGVETPAEGIRQFIDDGAKASGI